jgi:hypothetical protein
MEMEVKKALKVMYFVHEFLLYINTYTGTYLWSIPNQFLNWNKPTSSLMLLYYARNVLGFKNTVTESQKA